MEPPSGGDATTLKNAMVSVFRAMPEADPAHYVRGQYDGYRDIDGVRRRLDHRDLRGPAPRDRQLALVGRAVLHPHGQAPAGHADRAAARLQGPAAARLPAARSPSARSPNQLVVKLDPIDRHQAARRRPARRRGRARADQPGHGVRRGGRRGRHALRGAAARGDDRRQQALHAPGQRRGGLAGDAAAARLAPAGAPLREGIVGPGGRRPARRRRTAAGTARGWRHERPPEAAPPQSAAAPSPFPPIADYAFLSNCHTGALVAPDGVDRLALRAALRLAERLRHAARPRRPARFRLGPVRDQRARRRGSTSPGTNTLAHDLEHARPAGSWCATR